MAVFDASGVPAPQINTSEPVYNIRFEADLTDVGSLSTLEADRVLNL